ncbi:hypothetical protein POPTR_010G173050v4 [Populus trichocarpa]|jgi:hypothetical protein|uniref:Uncharacterized protein n=1 Tax=Populus trichocarpa TaxID=3694 RepID=A0ACC0SE04_POPTR|nr:hypothetical protein POPTR_010G173050v4 [Populus trichocarpa]
MTFPQFTIHRHSSQTTESFDPLSRFSNDLIALLETRESSGFSNFTVNLGHLLSNSSIFYFHDPTSCKKEIHECNPPQACQTKEQFPTPRRYMLILSLPWNKSCSGKQQMKTRTLPFSDYWRSFREKDPPGRPGKDTEWTENESFGE